jgi:hypothetical protein
MTFFTYDDEEIEQDTLDVLSASAVLEITEFRLFELAYERWFGEPPVEEKVEPVYARYMFCAIAPFWVRQYCRDVMARERMGALDPREFGVFPTPESDTMVQRGLRYGMIVLFVMLTLHLVAILVSKY